jgi:hypothetical protein
MVADPWIIDPIRVWLAGWCDVLGSDLSSGCVSQAGLDKWYALIICLGSRPRYNNAHWLVSLPGVHSRLCIGSSEVRRDILFVQMFPLTVLISQDLTRLIRSP